MAYCWWSSDDFQCDVYVYKDVHGGYTTHVAGNRVVFKEPLPEPVMWEPDNVEPWLQRHEKVMEMVDAADRVPIGGPHDGESFNDPTPGECADRLEALRAAGYRVPQDAIDALRAEEANAQPTKANDGIKSTLQWLAEKALFWFFGYVKAETEDG